MSNGKKKIVQFRWVFFELFCFLTSYTHCSMDGLKQCICFCALRRYYYIDHMIQIKCATMGVNSVHETIIVSYYSRIFLNLSFCISIRPILNHISKWKETTRWKRNAEYIKGQKQWFEQLNRVERTTPFGCYLIQYYIYILNYIFRQIITIIIVMTRNVKHATDWRRPWHCCPLHFRISSGPAILAAYLFHNSTLLRFEIAFVAFHSTHASTFALWVSSSLTFVSHAPAKQQIGTLHFSRK